MYILLIFNSIIATKRIFFVTKTKTTRTILSINVHQSQYNKSCKRAVKATAKRSLIL